MKIKTLALSAVLAVSALAHADDAKMKPGTGDTAQPALTETEIKILAHLHMVNMMEIEMGQWAQKNSKSAAIKGYGKMAVTDHQKNDKAVMALLKQKGVTKMPKTTMTDAEKAQHEQSMAAMNKLKTLKGPEFDRMYLTIMVEDHDRELAKIDTSISESPDPDMKKLLEDTRPVLQRHVDKARELQKQMETTSSVDKKQNQPATP